jgi:hypothetical protein
MAAGVRREQHRGKRGLHGCERAEQSKLAALRRCHAAFHGGSASLQGSDATLYVRDAILHRGDAALHRSRYTVIPWFA